MAKGSDLLRERIAEALERIATMLEALLDRDRPPVVAEEYTIEAEPPKEVPKEEEPKDEPVDKPVPPDSDR